jgi:hypothetical protein
MGRENDQPFPRGSTWYNGGFIPNFAGTLPATCDPNPGGWNLEGKEYLFEDGTSGTGVENNGYGTGFYVKVRCVRNNSNKNILPGQLCTFTTTYVDNVTTKPNGMIVGGTTNQLATFSYPADEFLPPAGVPQGDLFYIVVDGPCLLQLTTVAGTNVATTAGQKVVSSTANGSTAASGVGQIQPQSITESTDTQQVLTSNEIQNAIGRAMSQASSNATGAYILVDIGWE